MSRAILMPTRHLRGARCGALRCWISQRTPLRMPRLAQAARRHARPVDGRDCSMPVLKALARGRASQAQACGRCGAP
eukprot:14999629-Alexandrium_andersonii.AAC.1